jgi:hypothetical protein
MLLNRRSMIASGCFCVGGMHIKPTCAGERRTAGRNRAGSPRVVQPNGVTAARACATQQPQPVHCASCRLRTAGAAGHQMHSIMATRARKRADRWPGRHGDDGRLPPHQRLDARSR